MDRSMTHRTSVVMMIVFFHLALPVWAAIPFEHVVVDDSVKNPWAKIVADIDGDGFPDIVVGGQAGPLVWYRYPDWTKAIIAKGGYRTVDGEAGDIDGDGDLDIVMGGLIWYENPLPNGDPTGTLWEAHTIADHPTHDIELGDLDKDGRLDVVTRDQSDFGHNAGNRIYLWRQEVDNKWTHRVLDCPHGEGIALSDISGDSYPDIVIGGIWFENPGNVHDGDWQAHKFCDWHPSASVEVADINGDGRPDVVLSPSELKGNWHRLSWFEAPADPRQGDWAEHVIIERIECVIHGLATGDFNGDEAVDIAASEMHQGEDPDEVVIFFNRGKGAGWDKQVLSTKGSHCIQAADIGSDGDIDLVGANWSGPYQPLELWRNTMAPAQGRGTTLPRGQRDYHFDGPISREVLENYLSRSITMMDLCTGKGNVDDNVRMLQNIGAKFVGRAIYLWGGEQRIADPAFLQRGKEIAARLHEADPEMVLQGGIFEWVTQSVNTVPIPRWVFDAFSLQPEERNFNYQEMTFPVAPLQRRGSTPDITRLETKLWFYFLAVSYIDIGMEALHLGQVALVGRNDPDRKHWGEVVNHIRRYAAKHARRHWVICDAHVKNGSPVAGGTLLVDNNAFPLRPKEVSGSPQEAVLEEGFFDSIYGRSKGGLTPGGWTCEYLPYLVEVDNWGPSMIGGQESQKPKPNYWVWGYDEMSWFARQPEQYRNEWLRYAWNWLKQHDPNGFLQMPGSRVLHNPVETEDGRRIDWYFANTNSAACPTGFNQEETIKTIWQEDTQPAESRRKAATSRTGAKLKITRDRVERWDVFEVALTASEHSERPFEHVQLSARFTVNSTDKTVNGFYDGNATWKIRFMPEETGEYTFRTESNRSEFDGLEGTFRSVAPSPGNHGPVRINGHHFSYADGTPCFILGTTIYGWTFRPEEVRQETLMSLKEHKFNKARMVVFPQYFKNAAGDDVFEGIDISYVPPMPPYQGNPYQWDYRVLNVEYFRNLEDRIRELQDIGVEADVILLHNYDFGLWGIDDGLSDDDALFYLDYLMARISSLRNVWWSLANEYDLVMPEGRNARSVPNRRDWDRIGNHIMASDPYGHPRSIHEWSKIYPNQPWMTHVSYQKPDTYHLLIDLKQKYQKPVIADEYRYEGNLRHGWGNLTPHQGLFSHWLSVMAGGYATHGDCYVTETNKRDAFFTYGGEIAGKGAARLTYLKEIVDELPVREMEPNQGLGNGRDRFCLSKGDDVHLFLLSEACADRKLELAVRGATAAVYDVTVYDAWDCSTVDHALGVRRYDASRRPGLIVVKAVKSRQPEN